MKHSYRKALLLFTTLLFIICTQGCKKDVQVITCPFTEITWDSSLEDIQETAGKLLETRDSVYDGKSYLYAKEYKGYDGTVYYIFDDKEALVSMAWGYAGTSTKELEDLKGKIYNELVETYGECNYDTELGGGSVWYTDGGNIVLFSIDTAEYKALQLNYVHPDVAEKE